MALSCGNYATFFISGTASITQSETRHVGDAADARREETLDNIEALIAEDKLARHGLPGLGTTLDNLGFVRVYIKRREDYEAVRAVCEPAPGRTARGVRHRRRLPAGTVGGDRRHRFLPTPRHLIATV